MTEIIIFIWIIPGMALYMIHPETAKDSYTVELLKVVGLIIFAPVIIMKLIIEKMLL